MQTIEILKSKGIKVTLQRIKVLEHIMKINDHLTAEQIHKAISTTNEILSLATVYNTLGLFVNKGILLKLNGPEDKAFFDVTIKDHFHFYCTKCKSIHDVSSTNIDVASMDFKGNKVDSFYGYFIGTCNECNKGVKQSRLLNLLRQKVKIFNRR